MRTNSTKGDLLVASMLLLGGASLFHAFSEFECSSPARFACYFILALMSSSMKVSLPSINGTMSVAFLFTLIGLEELTLGETLLMICSATLVQSLWRTERRPLPVHVIFNVSNNAIAISACYMVYAWPVFALYRFGGPLRLVLAAALYFGFNTLPVAAMIAFTEGKRLTRVWQECYFWSFPYYFAGAAAAAAITLANRFIGWEITVLLLPMAYLAFRVYRLYLGRLSDQKRYAEDLRKHAEDIASLHLRTIEALAMAIEAKDHTTHDHLRRVQVYAVEIGKEMGLSAEELEALRAAALLHDIGKLAVPEHIISKPGKLTAEEFEKMKIHPVVGAEILERVKFPYPVVPIVSAHHEKWNGKGYPYGLKGEEIPIGARILAAVDCLDAIASDRQYRRALPLDEAMQVVRSESGKAYDPTVVEILGRRYRELEHLAKRSPNANVKLSTDLKIENGKAPAVGLDTSEHASWDLSPGHNSDFMQSIAAARDEVQALFEMAQDLGNSLYLGETLSGLAVKLKRVIAYHAIAIYIVCDDKLLPEYVSGDDFRLFASLEIPIGQGLSGWVAENRKSIINGNPSVEPGYLNDPQKFSTLRSALAVPLEGLTGVVGVLTLYHMDRDAFSRDHLRILKALSAKVSLSIENALKFRMAESSATTDYLTGLPNARALSRHLKSELERCRHTRLPLAVLVCDLDGFKQVNDRYGHLEGNRILQFVGNGLQTCCRDCDYVARMGGDEFVLVLPGFDPIALEHKIEQLSRMVAEVGDLLCRGAGLSLSVGASFYLGGPADPEQLLAEADLRMYKVKEEHRQRFVPSALTQPMLTTRVQ